MLWLEYESSQTVTKQLVQEVVCGIYQLIKPSPVAAEDWNNDSGIAIIAFDGTHDDFSSSDNSDYPSINDLVTGLSLDQHSVQEQDHPVIDISQHAYQLSANERPRRGEQGCTDDTGGASNAANSGADSRRNEESATSSANR